jgi:hypothetical protein
MAHYDWWSIAFGASSAHGRTVRVGADHLLRTAPHRSTGEVLIGEPFEAFRPLELLPAAETPDAATHRDHRRNSRGPERRRSRRPGPRRHFAANGEGCVVEPETGRRWAAPPANSVAAVIAPLSLQRWHYQSRQHVNDSVLQPDGLDASN